MEKKDFNSPVDPSKSRSGSFTEPEGFTHGMVSDVDPHFQLKGSYSDAMNIRLTNSDGYTFTVENIEGNSLFVDLKTFHIDTLPDQYQAPGGGSYPTWFDRGPDGDTVQNNYNLANRGSIVGHVSYKTQMLLIVVVASRFDRNYDYSSGADNTNSPTRADKNRTIFLLVDFDANFTVTKVTDLRVCYEAVGKEYPDLNMDIDRALRIEHIIENDNINRIYWTDNKNPLRTLNIRQPQLDELSIDSLDITPLMEPSQITIDKTLHGSLPVGTYQYTYKYISKNGGETTFSPISNMYHVSNQNFGSSANYGGGPRGELGSQGFMLSIADLDQDFDYVEVYALLYESLNSAPRVAIVSRREIAGPTVTLNHVSWNNEVPQGLEEVLIESNTWDICKDIAIKDNILFAGNLRAKKNWISEQEWNVKVMRWRIAPGTNERFLDAMLTTNDRAVKHYEDTGSGPQEIRTLDSSNQVVLSKLGYKEDNAGFYCGYGQLLGQENTTNIKSAYEASTYTYFHDTGVYLNPMWTTCLENQRIGGTGSFNGKTKSQFEYRFLSDRATLGAESFNYSDNHLGGCRLSFGVKEREADDTTNTNTSPFVSATSKGEEFKTELGHQRYQESGTDFLDVMYDDTTGTKFNTSMSLGGSYDPHSAGDRRGYQRGEIYRFGVQVYDKNGSPGNVLWIGDIQMPEQHDLLRMIDTERATGTGGDLTVSPGAASSNDKRKSKSGYHYSPFRPTVDGYDTNWHELNKRSYSSSLIVSHEHTQDFRLSYLYGHAIPPTDVEWFTARCTDSEQNLNAYVGHDGTYYDIPPESTTGLNNGRAKGISRARSVFNSGPRDTHQEGFDNTHYLFDLYVNFEFIIPEDVCEKISGFRVVRAERKEDDRRIVQQGLLNQTIQYGDASQGLEAGYGQTKFSREDNNGFDDDPIFVNGMNDPATAGLDATPVEQPEYNTYLNGYMGLAENSFIAFHRSNYEHGLATAGGNTDKEVHYWPEKGDPKAIGTTAGTFAIPHTGHATFPYAGGGHCGELRRKSAYFGSHDLRDTISTGSSVWPNDSGTAGQDHLRRQQNYAVSGSIFTLDAPDSAFGMRPYVYREGDHLRIDCVLKLSNDKRYNTHGSQGFTWNTSYPSNWHQFSSGSWEPGATGSDDYYLGLSSTSYLNEILHHADGLGGPVTLQECLNYASRYDIDNDYGVLIGKFYCFDPYFGIGMELDGGNFAAASWGLSVSQAVWKPANKHGYQLPLAGAKEIVDGEIVPKSFFKKTPRMKSGTVHGFSNNTLGFVRHFRGEAGEYPDYHTPSQSSHRMVQYYVFDAVYKGLSKWDGQKGGQVWGPDQNEDWSESKQKKDFNYDTISTMQMGLRSILLEVNTKISEVRRFNYGGHGTSFEDQPVYTEGYYREWFACPDLSIIYQQGDWFGGQPQDGYKPGDSSVHNDTRREPATVNSVIHNAELMGNQGGTVVKELGPDKREIGKVSLGRRNFHPHKYLCSIVRRTIPYNGHSKQAIESTRYIPCGNFHPVSKSLPTTNNSAIMNNDRRQGHLSKVFGGDTFVNLYSHQKTSTPYMKKSCARWQVFPVESYVNTDMRSGLALTNGDTEVGKELNKAPYSNDWFYNSVYSQEGNTKGALMVDENVPENLDLPYEIAYSNTKILGQTGDAFRQFPINQFHNMEGLYGEINRLVNFKNEIYVLQDSAFSKLMVNPVSMLTDDKGTSLFTGTGETVENHIYISTKYGTQHKFSVAQSESSLYFVDSNFARLFKYDTEKLISLGDSLGQRNYLHNIIKEWYHQKTVPTGGFDEKLHGRLDSNQKKSGDRDYFSDNPLKLLGIYSVFDFKNKELLVTFHNSAWHTLNSVKQKFAIPETNQGMGSTTNGVAIGKSETLVYSEAINSFISKYNVAPPQWLTGGSSSFILCPENEISVHSIANIPHPGATNYEHLPYDVFGSYDKERYRNYRCNPLRLWLWDKHDEGMKNNFFGRKDDVYGNSSATTPSEADFDTSSTHSPTYDVKVDGTKYVAEESYVEKVINEEAGHAKVFDNSRIIMTPEENTFSKVEFNTEVSEKQEIIVNKRWDFDNTRHGFSLADGSVEDTSQLYNPGQSTVTLNYTASNTNFRTPGHKRFGSKSTPTYGSQSGDAIHLEGKYNNIIRVKLKRTSGSAWQGDIFWRGYKKEWLEDPTTNWTYYGEIGARKGNIPLPDGIDSGFVIAEWDMSGTPEWNDSMIENIRFDFDSDVSTYVVDWIEIGSRTKTRYDDGVLKLPLRTEESIRRTRGTWAKIKYTAKTTNKFNIFAILAKYRKLFLK